ncbi:hypothetical protein [Streptomyces sp. NPDC059828]|uniref:hypothetical protein n=1 Tax=Streptomyces sp. NPDC059828 TaxID=3346965 RepID=UPI0036480E0A
MRTTIRPGLLLPVAALGLLLVCVLALAPVPPAAAASTPSTASAGSATDDGKPAVRLSAQQAGKGGDITVSGTDWRPKALLMLLMCGQSTPGRGVIGGTNACANAEGRAVTTDAKGAFSMKLPVAEPPKPCPCVVHVATVTGEQGAVDTVFTVAGHPSAPLPQPAGDGRLAVLATLQLRGSSGLLVWFGAPPGRELVFTVGNLGSTPIRDPVFQVGTAHGVFAPQWEERQWRGTVEPGRKAQIRLPVELSAGAHGDYQISVRYGSKVIAEQPWGVGRPWGVTLFWVLLAVVVPAALYRIGMAIVDRARPGTRPWTRPQRGGGRHRPARTPRTADHGSPAAANGRPGPAALPWFTPDATQDSAPSENRSTTKGHT